MSCKPKKPSLRMADGGEVPPTSLRGLYNRLTTSAPVAPRVAPASAPVAPASAPQTGISGYVANGALARREAAAGLQDGGQVPGTGKGDKIPAKYEPGEFVVSNDMIDDNPGLREQLHTMRAQTLAARGKDPLFVDAQQWRGGTLRAEDGEEGMFSRRAQVVAPAPESVPEVGRPVAPGPEPIPTAIAEGNARGQTFRAEQAAATARLAPTPEMALEPKAVPPTMRAAPQPFAPALESPAQADARIQGLSQPPLVRAAPEWTTAGAERVPQPGPTSVAREVPIRVNPIPEVSPIPGGLGPNKAPDLGAQRATWNAPPGAPPEPAPKGFTAKVNDFAARTNAAAGVMNERNAKMVGTMRAGIDSAKAAGSAVTNAAGAVLSNPVVRGAGTLLGAVDAVDQYGRFNESMDKGDTVGAVNAAMRGGSSALSLAPTPVGAVAGAFRAGLAVGDGVNHVLDNTGNAGIRVKDAIGSGVNTVATKLGVGGVDTRAWDLLDKYGDINKIPAAELAAVQASINQPARAAASAPVAAAPTMRSADEAARDAAIHAQSNANLSAAMQAGSGGVAPPSNIIRKGNSYEGGNISGNPTVNGAAMRGAFSDVSDPNVSSADRVAQIERSAAHEANMARMRAQMSDAANPMAGVTGLIGSGGYGDSRRSAEQRARDAEVSASSITAPGGRFSLGGRHANHVLGLQSAERIANQNNMAHLATARMNNDTSVLTTGMNNATMREGNRLNNETSLMTTDMNNRVSLRNNEMNNDFNWGKFQVEVGQKDREHARNVANDNFTQREASNKTMHDHFASLLPPVLVDGKPVADTAGAARLANGFVAQMAAHERTLRADAKAGKPGAQAALDELLQKGPGAYGPEDRQRFAAGMMARDAVAQNHSGPFNPVGGTAPITQAPVVRMRPHKNSALQFGESYDVEYADGSTGTVPARAIDKDGSFFGGQRRGDFNTLIQR